MEGTVAQIADERDRRLADCDARLAQARKVAADSARQVERLDAMMRDEDLTLPEWRGWPQSPQREAEAAALAIEDLTAEREEIEATLDVADATSEFMERIAALRASVAGEIISAEGITATQNALRRVFDGFTLHGLEHPRHLAGNAELVVGSSYVLEPRVREELGSGRCPLEPRWLLARRCRWHRATHARPAKAAITVRVRQRLYPPRSCSSPRSRWPSPPDPGTNALD